MGFKPPQTLNSESCGLETVPGAAGRTRLPPQYSPGAHVSLPTLCTVASQTEIMTQTSAYRDPVDSRDLRGGDLGFRTV